MKSADGQLQTQQGEPVLDAAMQPMTFPDGTVTISQDGSVSVLGGVVGKLGVFKLPAKGLVLEGTNKDAAADGVKPELETDAVVRQGAVEGSNQDAVHGTMQLILIQRQAEMMQKALSAFHNDFDRAASEDLPKV